MKNLRLFAQILLLISILFGGQAMAQSTIFNIPTTDTVAKGKVYAEFDFLPEVPGADYSRTYVYNPRIVVGAPGNVEFGVNFPIYNTQFSGSSSTTYAYIQPNAKWRLYNKESSGIAVALGGLLNTPLNRREGQDSWGLLYGLVSEKFKGNYGPRIHVGPYGVVSSNIDPVSFYGPRAGVILGYEQPIQKRISFVADWYSGKNGLGYFTPGISITLPKNSLLNAGYSIGNDTWGNSNATRNRFMFLYYGITF
ncbi:MAG TPA: hypothetical protein VMG30_13210 [Acidobacteriota bacterium]|nr:hypothetical protein [Acidobacteriota bacterium]